MKLIRWATRRVRVQSVILSGQRKSPTRWNDWLQWETLKVWLPVIVLGGLEATVIDLPDALWAFLLLGMLAYSAIIVLVAVRVAFTLLRRRTTYLRELGYDLSIGSALMDWKAWRRGPGGTMRAFLKSRAPKPPQAG